VVSFGQFREKTADSDSVEVLDESIMNLYIHLRLPGHRAQRLSTDLVGGKHAGTDAMFIRPTCHAFDNNAEVTVISGSLKGLDIRPAGRDRTPSCLSSCALFDLQLAHSTSSLS